MKYIYIFTILLLVNVFDVNGYVYLENFQRRGPNPATACSKCRMNYYIHLVETNTSDVVWFTFFQGVAPMNLMVATLTYNDNSSAVYKLLFDVPVGTYLFLPFTFNTTFASDPQTQIFNSLQIDERLVCNPMPATVTVDKETTYIGYPYFYKVFTLLEDLSNVTYSLSITPSFTCTTTSPAYTCFTSMSFQGTNTIDYISYLSPNLTLSGTQNYYDTFVMNISIIYGTFISYNLSFPITEPLIPFQTDVTTQYNSVTRYPAQTVDPLLIQPGHQGFSMVLFNMSNPNTLLYNNRFESIVPTAGDQSNTISLASLFGSFSLNFYQLSNNITQIYSSSFDFLVYYDNTPSFFSIFPSVNTANGNQLMIEVSCVVPKFFPVASANFASALPNYPFGFSLVNNDTSVGYQITTQYYRSKLINSLGLNLRTSIYGSGSLDVSFIPLTDVEAPVVHWTKIYYSPKYTYLVVNITDDFSGVNYIRGDALSSFKTLSEGDKLNGVYILEMGVDSYTPKNSFSPPVVYVEDQQGNNAFYDTACISLQCLTTPPLLNPSVYFEPWDFTYLEFIPNNIDTTNRTNNVTLFYNVTNPNIYYTSTVKLVLNGFSYLEYKEFPSQWDYTNKLFRCDMTIQQNLANGSLLYLLHGLWGEMELAAYFGTNATLQVWSEQADMIPPFVEMIKVLPSPNVTVPPSTNVNLEFQMVVQDSLNGFKGGYIKFISNIDGNPFEFNFNSTTRIDGDIYNGTYSFVIPVNGDICVSQMYYISEMYLEDNAGRSSNYPTYDYINNNRMANSLVKVYFNSNTNISIICQDSYDKVKPTIASFSVTPKLIDIGSLNRNVSFRLTTFDGESGISSRHDPKVYLSEYKGSIITIDHYRKVIVNQTHVTYYYQTITPPIFGFENITLSVYGIVDNQLNLNGYSTNQLYNQSFDYVIETKCSTLQPIITNNTFMYRHGGVITLYGFGFGGPLDGSIVYVDYGNGYIQQPALDWVYKFVYVTLVNPIPRNYINIKIQRGLKVSNIYTIPITNYFPSILPPEPQPLSCPGTPPCSGNGNCTFNGCDCYSPWYGPTCNSKTIIIPAPPANTTDPVIIIDTGNGTQSSSTTGSDESNIELRTIISIYSIRELSIDGKSIIKEFKFSNWTFTNLTTSSGSTKYQYSTQLVNRTTIFNVTVEWMTNETVVEFAGQEMILPPYSTKMSMNLTSYQFQSQLNTLQIIFNVEVSSSSGFECKGKQYGLGNGDISDLQWMKLNIDNKSLYGNFIRRGIVDGRVTSIRNTLLDSEFGSTTSSELQSFIGINVPSYFKMVQLDPDFSHLLDVGGNQDGQTCNGGQESRSGLSLGQIAGIVIGCIAAVAIAISAYVFYKKKLAISKENKRITMKVKNMK